MKRTTDHGQLHNGLPEIHLYKIPAKLNGIESTAAESSRLARTAVWCRGPARPARERKTVAPYFRYLTILAATAAPVNASFASYMVSCQSRRRYDCQNKPISPHHMAHTGARPRTVSGMRVRCASSSSGLGSRPNDDLAHVDIGRVARSRTRWPERRVRGDRDSVPDLH